MLRVPLVSTEAGRKLDMGGGDSRDKLMVGGLIVVIIGALAVLVWSVMGGDEEGRGAQQTLLQCADPACANEVRMTNEEWGEAIAAMDPQLVKSMGNNPRLMCPKCQNPKYSLAKGMTCPKCGDSFVAPMVMYAVRRALGIPATPPPRGATITCPYCGQEDVLRYWRENKGRSTR